LPLTDYLAAIKAVKRAGAKVNTYILIGAPYLTEREIINRTTESVFFAWNSGSDIVSLETYCVQNGTPWHALHAGGKLVLPSLWSIVEIIKKIDCMSPGWYLGEFADWPKPVAVPVNCPRCT
jgi:radical SAM enzyme (TIGR01210 family)